MRATEVAIDGAKMLTRVVKLGHIRQSVGHANPSMTQLIDRRRFIPTQSAAFVGAYEHVRRPLWGGGEPGEVGEGNGTICSGEHPR
jgi:hypothetical protein